MGRIPEVAYEAFDYMMNTRASYDLLGKALAYFNRKMARDRLTATQELNTYIFTSRWGGLLREAENAAVADHRKCFPDDEPNWLGYFGISVDSRFIMRLAIRHANRWTQQRGKHG